MAQIDEVLERPEFTDWSRSEWCREIIRTALRYYMRKSGAPEARPAPAQNSAPPAPAPEPSPPEADEVAPGPPGPPRPADCPHPQDARDYQTGTCAACGAILWD